MGGLGMGLGLEVGGKVGVSRALIGSVSVFSGDKRGDGTHSDFIGVITNDETSFRNHMFLTTRP